MLYEWKENSMHTNCFAACAHLPITVCEIERNICEKNPHFIIPPLHSTPPLGGSRRNIGTPFGMEKLEWCRYRMVKNFEDMFIRFDVIHERDGRTDRQTDTAWQQRPRLCIASRGKKALLSQTSRARCNALHRVSVSVWIVTEKWLDKIFKLERQRS